ncbi:MAG: F420-0--gamma-glutamyl ligase [Oscillospiraceae bacterium]
MEFVANESKKVEIETSTGVYQRHAIQTHFVQIGENYIDLIERYVKPLYEEGDLLSISEKVIALCQKRIVYRKDIHPGFWAKLLCRFVHVTPAGPGAGTPHKMQLIIMICGLPRVLLAAFCSAVTKLFGKKGVFYKVCGHEVDGIDGLIDYDISFKEYVDYGILNPENPSGVCDEIYEKTGVKAMIIDASDIDCVILGKCRNVTLTDEQLCEIVRDNPAGQEGQCTPFILIRKRLKATPHNESRGALRANRSCSIMRYCLNKQRKDLRRAAQVLSYSLVSSARNASTVGSRSVSGYS